MEPAEIANIARNFSTMVRAQGPDPKALKMKGHAFYLHQSGATTLSASGLLLPEGSLTDPPPIIRYIRSTRGYSGAMVVTAAALVDPFLTSQHRNNTSRAVEFSPNLIPGARIDVLVENNLSRGAEGVVASGWCSAELLALASVYASSIALDSLIDYPKSSFEDTSWESGWSLASCNDPQPLHVDRGYESQVSKKSSLSTSITKVAFLGIPMVDLKVLQRIEISLVLGRGDRLLVMGSPFGILSPAHFLNSISLGTVANFCPPSSLRWSLLMADIRCLPGMEGAPVFNCHSALVGILTRPIRQKGGNAEIQLVITWDAIANIEFDERTQGHAAEVKCSNVAAFCRSNDGGKSLKGFVDYPESCRLSQSYIDDTCSAVVLVMVGADTWASGVVISSKGLILTNAHILEPWRFRKASFLDSTRKGVMLTGQKFGTSQEGNLKNNQDLGTTYSSRDDEHSALFQNFRHENFKHISIRFNHIDCDKLYSARIIYISRGPLDVALLQLESFPTRLHAITPEFSLPSSGSMVHVIGHGLLGPRSEMFPSVSTGVLSNIIRIPEYEHLRGSSGLGLEKSLPIMLQTNAAVHPGASGGAVVNSVGHMVGLVTSNARLGGRSIIPHLNFSIPCAALRPVFEFAAADEQDLSVLKFLDKADGYLSTVWALAPLPEAPSPECPPIERSREDGKRGSRFAKFLSESQSGGIKSSEYSKIGRAQGGGGQSKL